jgi:hypothetical protein
MSFNQRTYQAPGPVAEAFLRSREPVRFLMGPIGSGKTNCCFFDGLNNAYQMPVCIDGLRRFAGVIFRDTYTKLWDTVIKSWWEWFPETLGSWSGVRGRQAMHKLTLGMPDGFSVEIIMMFRALDEHVDIEDALKGVEVSWAHLEEADTLNSDVLTNVLGRVIQRRYPPQRLLPQSAFNIDPQTGFKSPNYYAGVVGSLNPPDVDNYVYTIFEENRPPGYVLFKQPSGRSPRGENRRGVSLQSYEELARLNAHKPWYVKRMVDGEFGPSRDGQPVYTTYKDNVHCAEQPLKPLRLPLRLSFDQGVNGAAMIIRQLTPIGQVRVLDELVPGYRMGPTMFGQHCRAFLAAHYPEYPIQSASCDMAGFAGSDREAGDHAWAEIVARVMSIDIAPAPTNEIQPRIDCIAQLLSFFPEGEPALLISPSCKVLRKGFNSHYCYHLAQDGESKNLIPKKNMHANAMDALQYGVLDDFGLDGVLAGVPGGEIANRHRRRLRYQPTDDDDEQFDSGRYYPIVNSNFNVLRS